MTIVSSAWCLVTGASVFVKDTAIKSAFTVGDLNTANNARAVDQGLVRAVKILQGRLFISPTKKNLINKSEPCQGMT